MYHLTRETIVRTIDPKEAQSLLSFNEFEGQRKLNQVKARRYSELMESHRMRPVDVAIMTVPGGIKYLANGQHVLTAIIMYGKPFWARIEYYKCDTKQDAWHLFSTFDVHAARTEQQIARAARGNFEDENLHIIPYALLQYAGSALFFLSNGKMNFNLKPSNKTVKMDLVEEHSEEVVWLNSLQPSKNDAASRRILDRVSVITAMLATHRVEPEKATEFWRQVRDGEMLKKTDPQKRLHDALNCGLGSYAWKRKGDITRTVYCLCAVWWNAWITGENRNSVKLRAIKEIPKVLDSRGD